MSFTKRETERELVKRKREKLVKKRIEHEIRICDVECFYSNAILK